MNLLARLRTSFGAALPEGVDRAAFEKAVRAARPIPSLAIIRPMAAWRLAKALGRKPRDLAAEMAKAVDLGPLAGPPEVAGPGFLNLRLARRVGRRGACGAFG